MPAMEPLCRLIGIDSLKFSKYESQIMEMKLFTKICEKLNIFFEKRYEYYLRTIKITKQDDENMGTLFIRGIINDMVITDNYDVSGIAYYTRLPEEVILDVAIGRNIDPSFTFSRKVIELHRSVRPTLYQEIAKKIMMEYFAKNPAVWGSKK